MKLWLAVLCLPAWMSGQVLPPAQLHEDWQIVRHALEEAHPGIYRYTPKAKLDRIFDQSSARLDRPMSALELYRVLSPAVAALKCGHTSLVVPEETGRALAESIPLIPIEARILDGKIYVFRDYSESSRLAGAELRSINGVPARKILNTMLASIHGDGDTPTAGPSRISHHHTFAEALYTLAGLESPYRIRYALRGKSSEIVLAGVPKKKMDETAARRFPQDARPPASATYKLIQGGSIGVLRVYGFGGKAEDGKPLREFFQTVFTDLNAKKVPNLIIDVRDNGGGADELGKQLFSYLVNEPFPYYNDLVINKLKFDFFKYAVHPQPIPEDRVQKMPNGKYRLVSHGNWGTQQPREPYFSGPVFVLMNGGSFSTTCEFLSTLHHHHHRASFIGEEAAGGYYGNTSGPGATLVLPNSKIRLQVRFMTYYLAIEGNEHGARSIPPDHPVKYTIEEVLAGQDKEMETALHLIAALHSGDATPHSMDRRPRRAAGFLRLSAEAFRARVAED